MSDKNASLRQKIAGKRLIGFDTTSWAAHASARVGGKPDKSETDVSVATKVGLKPDLGASVAAKVGLKPDVRASIAAKVGTKPM
jgi:hypothetical protein